MNNTHSLNSERRTNRIKTQAQHRWVKVINPLNQRELLHACDHCGVVKSQHTLFKHCAASQDQHLISSTLRLVS